MLLLQKTNCTVHYRRPSGRSELGGLITESSGIDIKDEEIDPTCCGHSAAAR